MNTITDSSDPYINSEAAASFLFGPEQVGNAVWASQRDAAAWSQEVVWGSWGLGCRVKGSVGFRV